MNTKIEGLVDGILYQQHERTDELNERIQQRISSDSPLQPVYDPRPVSTKYATFPMVDRRVDPSVPLSSYLDYSTADSFASMQRKGPVDGFFSKVNDESVLRNQVHPLGSGSSGVYVPSSNSDLYMVGPLAGSIMDAQPFPGLFTSYAVTSPDLLVGAGVGQQTFLNSTRVQLRGEGTLR
jgi:hypothetical protein